MLTLGLQSGRDRKGLLTVTRVVDHYLVPILLGSRLEDDAGPFVVEQGSADGNFAEQGLASSK
ncbi:hypothetical protein D3C87_1167540 [compost metagenome]